MKFRICCLLALFFLNTIVVSALKDKKPQGTTMTAKRFSKPAALLTIESPDGDVIDCIDKRNQPSFNHPFLRDHKIQRVPKQWREIKSEANSNEVVQSWLKNETRCPKGTIPIRRTSTDNVMTNDVKHHGPTDPDPHEHAMAVYNVETEIYGVKARINVWNPEVEVYNEYSVAKIRITSGDDEELNVIEAGLHVYPSLYENSTATKFFIFTMVDALNTAGCYNLDCEEFVQTNNATVIGESIDTISTYNGRQHYITVYIIRDGAGNWRLIVSGNEIGYWPVNMFTSLADPATHVSWGGGVLNLRSHQRHTSTEMGSGQFPNQGHGKASSFDDLQVKIGQHTLLHPVSLDDISQETTHSNCYNIDIHAFPPNQGLGVGFFYGGPGHNPYCP